MSQPQTDFQIRMDIPVTGEITQTAIENRQALIDAYEKIILGHSDAIHDLLDEECEFFEAPSLPYGASKKGRAEVMEGVEAMFAAWKSLHIEIFEILTAGDLVIVYMSMKAVSRETGRTYDGWTAEMFRFRDGKIVEWRPVYWDTHMVRKVCGLE